MSLTWIAERLEQPDILNMPEMQASLAETRQMQEFARDMAVVGSFGRRIGGTGDGKVVADLPKGLVMWLWQFEPEVLTDKVKFHEFMRKTNYRWAIK